MVSVLVPAYNVEKYIKRCLDSIISQSYDDLQIIIVLDGSEDRTQIICEEYASRDHRIELFCQKNKGVAAARNECLRHVKGDYVQFVDADDWIEPDLLEIQLRSIESSVDIDISFCGHDMRSAENDVISCSINKESIWNLEDQKREFIIHKRITGMLWNKLFRTSLFDGCSFDEQFGYGEDAQMLWQLLKKSRNMILVPQILYHHCDNEDSISAMKYSMTKFKANLMWAKIAEDIKFNYPQWTDLAREHLVDVATWDRYEMIVSGYSDKTIHSYLNRIVRKNADIIIKGKNLSIKRKLLAVLMILGL